MSILKYLVVGSLMLTACAQPPVRTDSSETETAQSEQGHSAMHPEQQEQVVPAYPNIELSSELLYEFLLTEVANQRGHTALAVESSSDLAKKTRDPRLAQRATQLALESGEMEKAIEAFRIWQEADPASTLANRMLASILLRGGKLDEAGVEFAKTLKDSGDSAGHTFLQIYQMVAPYPDKNAGLKLLRDLAEPYPDFPEAHWVVAHMAYIANNNELALDEVRKAARLRPDWSMAVSLEAQLLQKDAPQQGLDILSRYLAKYPQLRDIRLQYARALLEQKKFKQSREEFQRLAKENPDNPELAFAIAMISLQLNDLQSAEEQLQEALSKGKKEQDAVQYYLGQLSEMKERDDEALAHYREVKRGEYLFSAQLRVASLLGKSGKLDEAREQLHRIQADNNQQRVRLLLSEAELLREAKQFGEAFSVLQQGLEKLPNHPDLLYETAMLADKTGKPAIFEQLMNKLIQVRPDHAHAYNALGYSFLERNERIPEAVKLVEKALELAPGDIAIMDSVGWGYYRLGKLDESLKLLRKAFAGNPDPEIAAHLGEVLWVRGDKEEAKKIWLDSLKANPGETHLQEVIKRFMPE